MYRLIIVDDERQIRKGIQKILNWEEYGIEIVGEAANGVQALELIQKVKPDIVFTDIHMPKMNGIELLESIKTSELSMLSVVLSGYDDYRLVRKAMKAGALDYILKPFSELQIINIVEEILERMDKIDIDKVNTEQGLLWLRDNVFNRLVGGMIDSIELREKIQVLGLKLPKTRCYMAVTRVGEFEEAMDEMARRKEIKQILDAYEEILDKEIGEYAFLNYKGEICIIFVLKEAKGQRDNKKNPLDTFLGKLKKMIPDTITVGAGGVVSNYRGLKTSYEQARTALNYRYVFDNLEVLYYEEIEKFFVDQDIMIDIKARELTEIIDQGNPKKTRQYVGTIFNPNEVNVILPDIFVLRNAAMEVIFTAHQYAQGNPLIDKALLNKEKYNALNQLYFADTKEKIVQIIVTDIDALANEAMRANNSNFSKLIFDLVLYSREHYKDNALSLQFLAERFQVNPAYLGRKFKKETGKSFTDFLNEIRVKKAIELLKTTNSKGTELSEYLGFTNYNYFYMVFKQITGQSPMNFRNSKKKCCI